MTDRRGFLAAFAGLVAAAGRSRQQAGDTLSPPGPAGRLYDPARAGRPLPPVVAADNDAAIQAIEKQLKCQCGCNLDIYTCRTTDFSCTTSPALHREVVALAEGGRTAQQILDAFVAEYGVAVLMAPPKRGFNLAGYFVPGLVVLAAGAALVVLLRRWTRGAPAPAPVASSDSGASPGELERLRRELERFPG